MKIWNWKTNRSEEFENDEVSKSLRRSKRYLINLGVTLENRLKNLVTMETDNQDPLIEDLDKSYQSK